MECEHCTLDEVIVDRMEALVDTFIGARGNTKDIVIPLDTNIFDTTICTDIDNDLSEISVSTNDVKIRVRHQTGDLLERDCSCDSKYMAAAMQYVGVTMCENFHWVNHNTELYFLDNAGGHGTNTVIEQYINNLRDNYNIQII